MRKEANLHQWELLYEVAIKFKAIKPWNYLWDTDFAKILLPEYEDPTFCSVMGNAGECMAIGVYEGFDAINGLRYVTENQQISSTQFIRYQNNLICYFGNREELPSEDIKVIKDLGLKFRGKNEWIYFRALETRYAPYILDELQVVRLISVFQQLYMALKHYVEGRVKFYETLKIMTKRKKIKKL